MEKEESMRHKLVEIYGEEQGRANFDYIMQALDAYRPGKAHGGAIDKATKGVPETAAESPGTSRQPGRDPVDRLAGKIFAICYPDNVYNDTDPTLQTLGEVLDNYFPDISGIHVLPERPMSHDDLWPQDLHEFIPGDLAFDLIGYLQKRGVLTADRTIAREQTDGKPVAKPARILSDWYDERTATPAGDSRIKVGREEFLRRLQSMIDSRRKSHFNDGGFSQISRARVDPRFGDTQNLVELSHRYDLMLDYVVNHLDIDNEILEAFRRGENDGSAFIIISPEEYERRKKNGDIAKTFRPRPFPLFTGLRKYPVNGSEPKTDAMNKRFEESGLSPPDDRVTRFLSIYFKVRNDQGLGAEDRRIVTNFIDLISSHGTDTGRLFTESTVQEGQPALTKEAAAGMKEFCGLAGISSDYADVFERFDDEIYGEKFFVYTTFSESQADINPKSEAGFRLVVDDLFHLLNSGDLSMMRMDAIKYLWKEIGKRNFDMEEGNKLIDVIRLTLSIAEPELLPLDEVNSADQDVYRMGSDGGFYYLFGQVNALPAAFNTGSLRPLERLTATMAEKCPEDLLLFVLLSSHDGRSVQGIGVDRPDGHVSIRAFFQLQKVVEARGGKVKYRSVPQGMIPAGTFEKACFELGVDADAFDELFSREGDEYRLKSPQADGEEFRAAVEQTAGNAPDEETVSAVIDFLTDWVIIGRAAYELCCTTRSAFDPAGPDGRLLEPAEEARRVATAQVFVLSFGQSVPAVYFNDLLGISNDIEGYKTSGRPRDLNRHKSHIDELEDALANDEFTRIYVSMLNKAIHARSTDLAFHPKGDGYEFHAPGEKVFLNHAYNGGNHSFVIGNIDNKEAHVRIDFSRLEEAGGIREMTDRLSGERHSADGGKVDLELPGYGVLWLSTPMTL